jgi:hypothetical protein
MSDEYNNEVFDPKRMTYVDRIKFFNHDVVVACDGQCHLATKEVTSAYPAPCYSNIEFPNKWCVNECERCFMSECGEDLSRYDPFIQKHLKEHKTKHVTAEINGRIEKIGSVKTKRDALEQQALDEAFSDLEQAFGGRIKRIKHK